VTRAALLRWSPASLLALGAVCVVGVNTQRTLPLRQALPATIPWGIAGFRGRDMVLSEDERRVAGVTDYLLRSYRREDSRAAGVPAFSMYVGYYDRQTQGRTIHSPKNCLPGAGWVPLAAGAAKITTPAGAVTVNRYLVRQGSRAALVLYWYQGRGRVEASEYAVKWQLLRDAALKHRSDEALVRIVVPVTGSEEQAFEIAVAAARTLVPAVSAALPS